MIGNWKNWRSSSEDCNQSPVSRNEEDRLGWKEIKCGKFFVKSYHSSLTQGRSEPLPASVAWNP